MELRKVDGLKAQALKIEERHGDEAHLTAQAGSVVATMLKRCAKTLDALIRAEHCLLNNEPAAGTVAPAGLARKVDCRRRREWVSLGPFIRPGPQLRAARGRHHQAPLVAISSVKEDLDTIVLTKRTRLEVIATRIEAACTPCSYPIAWRAAKCEKRRRCLWCWRRGRAITTNQNRYQREAENGAVVQRGYATATSLASWKPPSFGCQANLRRS
jgi:hypothetical protein